MTQKLTKKSIEDLEATDKAQIIFDSELPGLVLKVTPKGVKSPDGSKVFQLRYRMGGRGTFAKTFTLGKFGKGLTLEQARKQAKLLKAQIELGTDPAAEKKAREVAQLGARTVEAVSVDFLASHGRHLKPKSLTEYRDCFRLHINPKLGDIAVRDLTRGDVRRLHEGMRAYPVAANRALKVLSVFMGWCIEGELRPEASGNPVTRVRRYVEKGRKRYLSQDEFAAIGAAIRICVADSVIDQWQAAVFQCLMLTGMRRGELQMLKWADVDLDANLFRLTDSKVGARDIPITLPVRDILEALPKVVGNPYVFCGRRPKKPTNNLFKPWARVLAVAKITTNTRLHDLRHSFASVGVGSNMSLPIVGAILGHSKAATTQRYAHLAADPVATASTSIATQIAAHMDGPRESSDSDGAEAGKVLKFRRRRLKTG